MCGAWIDGIDKIANEAWNPFHATLQYGKHNYVNRLIEIDSNNKNKATATWNMIAFFANKSDKNKEMMAPLTMSCFIYFGYFVKENGKWKVKHVNTKFDFIGVEIKDATIRKGSLYSEMNQLQSKL